jgi:hypothetical protein
MTEIKELEQPISPEEKPIYLTEGESRAIMKETLAKYDGLFRILSGNIQSGNFVTGSAGWRLTSLGDIEANGGVFRGSVESNVSGYRVVLDATNRRIAFYNGATLVGSLFTDANGWLTMKSESNSMMFAYGVNNIMEVGPNLVLPGSDNNVDLGGTGKRWRNFKMCGTQESSQSGVGQVGSDTYPYAESHFNAYYDHCLWLDEKDDLAILKTSQPKKDKDGKIIRNKDGNAILDNKTLPEWMQGGEDERGEMSRNMGHFVDVVAGAVRQLSDKLDSIDNRLTKLEL